MRSGQVIGVRVGHAVIREWGGRTFRTAAAKSLVEGPVHLGQLGFDGDEQGNRTVHGGPDKAALLYPAAHYPLWRAEGYDIPEGGFFENLTVDGLTEHDVHLGDRWRLGTAIVQVTQPRRPCRTIADRWARKELPLEVQATGRTGFYIRVLEEGLVAAGDDLVLLERHRTSVSAAETGRIMNVDRDDIDGIHRLLDSPELPESWRDKLRRRLAGVLEDDSARLGG